MSINTASYIWYREKPRLNKKRPIIREYYQRNLDKVPDSNAYWTTDKSRAMRFSEVGLADCFWWALDSMDPYNYGYEEICDS